MAWENWQGFLRQMRSRAGEEYGLADWCRGRRRLVKGWVRFQPIALGADEFGQPARITEFICTRCNRARSPRRPDILLLRQPELPTLDQRRPIRTVLQSITRAIAEQEETGGLQACGPMEGLRLGGAWGRLASLRFPPFFGPRPVTSVRPASPADRVFSPGRSRDLKSRPGPLTGAICREFHRAGRSRGQIDFGEPIVRCWKNGRPRDFGPGFLPIVSPPQARTLATRQSPLAQLWPG